MSVGSDAIPFATLEQAAEWYAVLRSGQVGDDELRRWQAWLDARESNRQAWARVEAISQGMACASAAPDAASSALHAASQLRQRRKIVKTLSLAALTGGLGWQLARHEEWRATIAGLGASHRTGIGEQRRLVLADGTQLWLNTGTAVDVRFDDRQRQLVLHHGEILIETHADARQAPRPFVVLSRQGRLRALGTRFTVRQFDGFTRLGVSEGRVEVAPLDAPVPRIVAAAQAVRFSRREIAPVAALSPAHQAWVHGMLIAQDLPLAQFLEELARYRHGHLGCDPAVAGLRVVGGFPLRDTDQALAMLQAALPVSVDFVLPWWVTVKPRQK